MVGAPEGPLPPPHHLHEQSEILRSVFFYPVRNIVCFQEQRIIFFPTSHSERSGSHEFEHVILPSKSLDASSFQFPNYDPVGGGAVYKKRSIRRRWQLPGSKASPRLSVSAGAKPSGTVAFPSLPRAETDTIRQRFLCIVGDGRAGSLLPSKALLLLCARPSQSENTTITIP